MAEGIPAYVTRHRAALELDMSADTFDEYVRKNRKLEVSLHRKFAAHHASGEWFRLDGALTEFLRSEGCDV